MQFELCRSVERSRHVFRWNSSGRHSTSTLMLFVRGNFFIGTCRFKYRTCLKNLFRKPPPHKNRPEDSPGARYQSGTSPEIIGPGGGRLSRRCKMHATALEGCRSGNQHRKSQSICEGKSASSYNNCRGWKAAGVVLRLSGVQSRQISYRHSRGAGKCGVIKRNR